MSFVSEYLTPFLDYYGRLLDGKYLSQQLAFKGSQETGGDYITKVIRSQQREITEPYHLSHAASTQPSLLFKTPLSPGSSLIICPDCYSIVLCLLVSLRPIGDSIPSLSQPQSALCETWYLQPHLHWNHERRTVPRCLQGNSVQRGPTRPCSLPLSLPSQQKRQWEQVLDIPDHILHPWCSLLSRRLTQEHPLRRHTRKIQ